MTSRKSYSKALIISLRRHLWSIALTSVGLFFAMPVYAAINISIIYTEYLNGILKENVLARVFSRNVTGEGNFMLFAITLVLAVIIALNGFSYLFARDKVDLYHSLPVKRRTLFAINYISGIITYAVPYIIFMIIMLVIGYAKGVLNTTGIVASLTMFAVNLLGFLGIYSITVLAVMLTGNTIVSLLALVTLCAYEPAVKSLIQFSNSIFYSTYSNESFHKAFSWTLSPISEYWKLRDGMNCFMNTIDLSAGKIILYTLFVIAAIAINCYLYMIRPSEAAGSSITFSITKPVISIMLLVPVSLFGAIAFNSITSNIGGKISYGWLIFGAIFTLFISHFVIQAIMYRDLSALIKNLLNPAISAAVVAVVLLIYCLDITGYDSYNPAESSKLADMAVSSYGIQGYAEYYNFDVDEDEYGNKYYYVDTNDYRLAHTKITDTALIQDFISTAITDTKNITRIQRENPDSNELYDNTAITEFTVRYDFQNGRSVYRRYNIDLLAHMDLYDRLYSSTEYKEGVFGILGLEDDDINNIMFANGAGTLNVAMTHDQMVKLVNTYKEELLSQGAYELANAYPVGYLYEEYSVWEYGYTNTYTLYKSYIYPSFVKTLALLDEYGIDVNAYLNMDNIESITVTNYEASPIAIDDISDVAEKRVATYAEDMYYSDGRTVEYTSPDDIAAIMNACIPSEMINADSSLKTNANLDVQLKLKESLNPTYYYVYCSFPKDKVPDFVATDLAYSY